MYRKTPLLLLIVVWLPSLGGRCAHAGASTPEKHAGLFPIEVIVGYEDKRKEAITRWGYIDASGRVVIRPTYEEAGDFHEGLAPVKMPGKGKYGYINTRGEWAIKLPRPRYYHLARFSCGVARITLHKSDWNDLFEEKGLDVWPVPHYYIGRTGKVVIEPRSSLQYPDGSFYEDRLDAKSKPAVKRQRNREEVQHGFIDPSGRRVIDFQFDETRPFSNGLAAVRVAYKWGYIDRMGRSVIPCEFLAAWDFSEGLAAVATKESWVYIDRSGRAVIKLRRRGKPLHPTWLRGPSLTRTGEISKGFAPGRFSEGLAAAPSVEEKSVVGWRYIDRAGNTAIKYVFQAAGDFSEGLALVWLPGARVTYARPGFGRSRREGRSEGVLSYIDKAGRIAIEGPFIRARPFWGGLARVETHDTWGYVDKSGRFVWQGPKRPTERLEKVTYRKGTLVAWEGEDPLAGKPDRPEKPLPRLTSPPVPALPPAREQVGNPKPGQSLDLLPLIQPKKDAVKGRWQLLGPSLAASGSAYDTRLMIPVAPRGSYALELRLTRTAGRDAASVHLPVGSSSCVLLLHGWGGETSGLDLLAGKRANANPTTARHPRLKNGRACTLKVRVIIRGDRADIQADLDGRKLIRWQGTQASLSKRTKLPDDRCLGLGVARGVDWTFSVLRLTMLSGKAELRR